MLMRFIRTQYGRSLRRACDTVGIPWVCCGGHGLKSLTMAIEEAIRLLGVRKHAA